MTKKLIASNVCIAISLMLAIASYADASEITGTLSSGAVTDPGSGTISGTVSGGGSGTISGTVSSGGGGGSSSGSRGRSSGGGGNSPDGEVLGASDTFVPSFPNAGYAPIDESTPWAMGTLGAFFTALMYGALRRKNYLP